MAPGVFGGVKKEKIKYVCYLRSEFCMATLCAMEIRTKYRGRKITDSDIAFIRAIIASHPKFSRWKLSKRLCEAWNWTQENGALKDMVCRGLMLQLHRLGHNELPPVRRVIPNPLANRRRPQSVQVDTTPLCGKLSGFQPLEFRLVRRTKEETTFNGLIEEHHYLGYTQPVGEHLKYMVYSENRLLACLAWCSAPRHLGPRDRFIGWSPEARRQNIRFIAYNTRFLILPWVEVPNLASHLLGRMARVLPKDWERVYGHRVFFLETFVDPTRYRGTCYRAANWVFLGRTTGRGKDDLTHKPNRPIKEILGYPLSRRFRERLGG